jgi:hypothetical protein
LKTAIAVAVLAVAGCFCALLLTIRATVAAVPGEIAVTRSALIDQVAALRVDAFAEIGQQATAIRQTADSQATAIRTDAMGQISGFRADANTRLDGLTLKLQGIANKADDQITGLRYQISPVLINAAALTASSTHLVDTYAALPAQLTTEIRPAWLAIQPEITCRQLDGSGYGGCWHSRITGLMGEAVRVGGVFTQHFPSMVSSMDGIGVDVHTFTTKFTAPTSTKTKIWDGFKSMALIASHF